MPLRTPVKSAAVCETRALPYPNTVSAPGICFVMLRDLLRDANVHLHPQFLLERVAFR
jgi:hypothetical protein